MKSKSVKCFLIFLLVFFAITSVSVYFFLKNTDMFIEKFNYKKYSTEIENGRMVIYKQRHLADNQVCGRNHSAPGGIYIYYNPESSSPKYVICTPSEIFTTSNEKLFWLKLSRDIPAKVSSQKIYLIQFCSETPAILQFLEKLRKQNAFVEMEVDRSFITPEFENDIAYFNYTKYDSLVTFAEYEICKCGSDSWIPFEEENTFTTKQKIRKSWFYY